MDVLMESRWTGSAGLGAVPRQAFELPEDVVRELAGAFELFDRDGDGRISAGELGAVLRVLGQRVSDADVARLVRGADADGDGAIDVLEFIALNAPSAGESEEEGDSLRAAFGVFDADGDGLISAEELQRVLAAFGDAGVTAEECRRLIRCVDQDGDHMLSFREFRALMAGELS